MHYNIRVTDHFVMNLVPMQLFIMRVISARSVTSTAMLTWSLRIVSRSSNACRNAPIITVGCICCSRNGPATDSISPAATLTSHSDMPHSQFSSISATTSRCMAFDGVTNHTALSAVLCHIHWSVYTNTNTTELVWRPLQTKFGQGRLTIKNKNY